VILDGVFSTVGDVFSMFLASGKCCVKITCT